MKRYFVALLLSWVSMFPSTGTFGQQTSFKVLAFYSTKVEPDHVLFAEGALKFFSGLSAKNNFTFDSTSNWDDMNDFNLGKYQVVVWLNDEPSKAEQKRAFQEYIENGGAWLGFHVAAYNDKDSNWPWFVDFLGGGVFHINSWPPLPAKLTVDDRSHPATIHLPGSFISPDNEWYIWKPSPRLNKGVRVLVTLDPSNYPIGFKDVLTGGDLPVVWTNTKYRMLYMNMGHGDKIFGSPIQNKLIEDATLWRGTISTQAEMPAASGAEISPHAVVVNPKTNKVYAVNSRDGTITVVDESGNSATTVRVGSEPMAIAVNPVTNKIYVGNTGSGTVSVIDGATDAVTATVKEGALPYVIAANPATNKIYAANAGSSNLTVIDGASNGTSVVKTGDIPCAIAVDSVTNRVYAVNYASDSVTVIDGANNSVIATVGVGARPQAIGVNSVTHTIYVANTHSNSVTIIDGTNNSVIATMEAGNGPYAIAVDTAANKAYVSNMGKNSLTVIDGRPTTIGGRPAEHARQ